MSATTVHIPILLEPIIEALTEKAAGLVSEAGPVWVVDCTLGGGGHTAALLERLRNLGLLGSGPRQVRVLSVDQDAGAVARAELRFSRELEAGELELWQGRFSGLIRWMGSQRVIGLMADLGFSSDQIEDAERGLSFLREGPLDMRLDPTQGESCREYLGRVPEDELVRILFEFGEERFSKRIAKALVSYRRENGAPKTTHELAELVLRCFPPAARYGRIHPATRTFQALRIVVNEELEELDSLLNDVIPLMQQGGRVAILSFHSLEDRKVKHAFKGQESVFHPLSKKPIEADEEEVARNPRSRSAKLRVAERH